jgi:nucleoid-associated protein YgaU
MASLEVSAAGAVAAASTAGFASAEAELAPQVDLAASDAALAAGTQGPGAAGEATAPAPLEPVVVAALEVSEQNAALPAAEAAPAALPEPLATGSESSADMAGVPGGEAVAGSLVGPVVATAEAQAPSVSQAAGEGGFADSADLSIRAAEVEDDTLYVAGEAAPGTEVRVYADEALVGEAEAGSDGTWLLEAEARVPAGEVVLRADAVAEGSPAPAGRAEVPFVRFEDGIVLEQVAVAASSADAVLAAAGTLSHPTYIIIRRGDNLWRIARRNYGRGIRYEAIYEANRDRIRNPHWIFPGQVFVIPTRDLTWEEAAN